MRSVWIAVLTLLVLSGSASAQDVRFSWDHATVYRVVTDRFSNGDSSNDYAYGRGLDGNGGAYDEDVTGHFHGGDYAGIQGWVDDGYFSDLGVNVLWLSAPYEQVHGWVGGGDGDFQLYGYDGSWPFDYTEFERAFGGEEAFRSLAAAARAAGQRIVVDVDLNHVGPFTMHDMAAYGFGGLIGETWRDWKPSSRVGWQSYQADQITIEDAEEGWQRWWGSDWVRANIVGYPMCGDDTATNCTNGLPDLRSDVEVDSLPPFLTLKWGETRTAEELASLDAFFARTGASRTAAHHVVKWLADWVLEQEIDGFHVREVEGIPTSVLNLLTTEVERAHRERHAAAGSEPGVPFLLFAHGASMTVDGNDRDVEWRNLEAFTTGRDLADETEALSASTDQDMRGLPLQTWSLGSASAEKADLFSFLLQPGPIVIEYGMESGREAGPEVSDAQHMANSAMNWSAFDEDRLALWTSVGAFRGAHPAVARGGFDLVQESPMAFHRGVRLGMDKDQVVIVTGAEGRTRLNVAIVWPDDTVLRDAMTGSVAFVSFGQVSVTAHPSGIILLEEVTD